MASPKIPSAIQNPSENGTEMATRKFPGEVMLGIFSYLPARSVTRFKCLSKIWRYEFSKPAFIKSHLSRQNRGDNILFINSADHSTNAITDLENEPVLWKVQTIGSWYFIKGSCDGLVLLLQKYQSCLFLVNPYTEQQARIPDSPLDLERKNRSFIVMYGFGYDMSTDDYKVITISYDVDDMDNMGPRDTFVEIYSVKTGVWKQIENFPFPYGPFTHYNRVGGAFVNGFLHWLAWSVESGQCIMVSFDLATENFVEFPGPTGVRLNYQYTPLAVLGDHLCVVESRSDPNIETVFWIMEEYGVAESWKICFTVPGFNRSLYPIKPREGDVVLVDEDDCLLAFNLKEKSLGKLLIDGGEIHVKDVCSFTGSLVCPMGPS